MGLCVQFHLHLATWLQLLCDCRNTYAVLLIRCWALEEKPFRHNNAPSVEDSHLVHPIRHRLSAHLNFHQWHSGKSVTSNDVTIMHDDIAKQVSTHAVGALNSGQHPFADGIDREGASLCSGLRKREKLHLTLLVLLQVPHLIGKLTCVRNHLEESSAQRIRLHHSQYISLLVHHKTFPLMRSPVVIHSQQCHPTSFANNQASSFRIELHADGFHQIFRVNSFVNGSLVERVVADANVRVTVGIKLRHDAQVRIISLLLRFLEDGKHP